MSESPVGREIVDDIKNSSPDCLIGQNDNMGSQQEMLESQSQTQNELTQLFEETGESSSTPLPIAASPLAAVNPRSIPWGRIIRLSDNNNKLVSDSNSGMGVELLPRDPIDHFNTSSMRTTRSKSLSLSLSSPTSNQHQHQFLENDKIVFLGITNLKSSDRFNQYVLGRSTKCDIVASKLPIRLNNGQTDETKQKNHWIHSMISNKHCNLFCLLKQSSVSNNNNNNNIDMEVYIQDTSGNGTLINQSTILHRNERRLLHTGDEICLINPATLRRKIRSIREQKEILTHYSFIFVNLYQNQRQHQNIHQNDLYYPIHDHTNGKSADQPDKTTIEQTRKGIVDAHATNNNSQTRFNVDSNDNNMPPPNNIKTSPKNILIPSSSTKTNITTNESSRRLEKYYDLRDVLGSGTCGEVRRAIHHKTGLQVAVKIIPIDERNQSRKALLGRYNQIHAEASILKSLNHPYIVQLLDVFYHPGKAIYLVMELLSGGDLFDRIVEKSRYNERDSRRIMRRLLSAVFYLHEECDIVHRDLKPENILCVSRTNDIFVKLSDFGLAKSITEDGLKTFCGTPQYFAPEVLKRRNTIAGMGRYGKEADMWSLGIILYILLCGAPPFDSSVGLDAVAQAKIRFSGPVWKGISKEAIDLIRKLLVVEPPKRIDVVSACKHVWILTEDGDSHISPLNDPLVIEHRKKDSKEATKPSETFDNNADSKSISSNGNHQQMAPPQSNLNSPEPQCQKFSKNTERATPQNKARENNQINSNHDKQPIVEDDKYIATPTNVKSVTNKSGLVISSLLNSDESARFPTPKREYIPTSGTNHQSHKQSLFSTVKQRSEEGKYSAQENKHTKDNLAKTELSSEFNFIEVKNDNISDKYRPDPAKKNSPENKKYVGELSDDEIKSDFSDECDEKDNNIEPSGLDSTDEKISLENQPHDNLSSKSFLPKYSQPPSDSKNAGAIGNHDKVSPKHLRSMKKDLSALLQEEGKMNLENSPMVEEAMNSSLHDSDNHTGLNNENGKGKNTTKSKQKKRAGQEQSSESNKKSLKSSHAETHGGLKGKQTTLSNWFKKK